MVQISPTQRPPINPRTTVQTVVRDQPKIEIGLHLLSTQNAARILPPRKSEKPTQLKRTGKCRLPWALAQRLELEAHFVVCESDMVQISPTQRPPINPRTTVQTVVRDQPKIEIGLHLLSTQNAARILPPRKSEKPTQLKRTGKCRLPWALAQRLELEAHIVSQV